MLKMIVGLLLVLVLVLALPHAGLAEEPLPIIDMHLHSNSAGDNGPPPVAMCVPMIPSLPPWDPQTASWGDLMISTAASPRTILVWSPTGR
jgi:hypothetical protein